MRISHLSLRLPLAAIMVALCLAVPALAAEPTGDEIVILHTNDVHCGMEDGLTYAGVSAYAKEMDPTMSPWWMPATPFKGAPLVP